MPLWEQDCATPYAGDKRQGQSDAFSSFTVLLLCVCLCIHVMLLMMLLLLLLFLLVVRC
jgi:hypothetical protein